MHKTTYTCDHCGKEIDYQHDFIDLELGSDCELIESDLCSDCYLNIMVTIKKFCNKEME